MTLQVGRLSLETGPERESFFVQDHFASMFNDITNWESRKVPEECLAQVKQQATCAAIFRLGFLEFLIYRIRKDTDKT